MPNSIPGQAYASMLAILFTFANTVWSQAPNKKEAKPGVFETFQLSTESRPFRSCQRTPR